MLNGFVQPPCYLFTSNPPSRPFQCTFCSTRFKSKHDWARHEKSQHLCLYEWLCILCAGAGRVSSPEAAQSDCTSTNSMSEPIATRNRSDCQWTAQLRTFARKDHLVQHLRRFHKLDCSPSTDDWKVKWPDIRSRCGFCGCTLPTWSDRIHHLADHFKAGRQMWEWEGDHGFDPSVAARVINQDRLIGSSGVRLPF